MNDFIRITGLKIHANHGVLSDEKENGQDFFLDAKLYYDMGQAVKKDTITKALDYAGVCESMRQAFTEKTFDLIETAACYVSEKLLSAYALLQKVELEVSKPQAPIPMEFSNVSVCIVKQWHQVYLSVGSNMGDRKETIKRGVEHLKKTAGIRNVDVTGLIETEPYGPLEQDPFLNGAIFLETWMKPEELLFCLQEIEAAEKRERKIHWGPRTLDLDIIFYDHLIYESPILVIPHSDMQNREFVLEPLLELCPHYRHPIYKKTVRELAQELAGKLADSLSDQ